MCAHSSMAWFHSWAEGTGSSSFQNASGLLLAQSDAEVTARIAGSVDDVTGSIPTFSRGRSESAAAIVAGTIT